MSVKLRIVLDTNVIVSGLINPNGAPGNILKAFREHRFILVTSPAINEEILDVLNRPRLREAYGLGRYLFDMAFLLWERTEVVTEEVVVQASRDSDDDKFLEAAVAGHADYLVTGDINDLLTLQQYQDIRIVTPETFLRILG